MREYRRERHVPDAEPLDPGLPSGLPGDAPIHSERGLWLYLGKGLLILLVAGFLLSNAMYAAFELLAYLAD